MITAFSSSIQARLKSLIKPAIRPKPSSSMSPASLQERWLN